MNLVQTLNNKSKILETFYTQTSIVNLKPQQIYVSVGYLLLLWYITNCSAITNTFIWNTITSIDTDGWRYYCVFMRVITILSLYFYTQLCGHFLVRAEEYFSDPTLDVRNASTNHVKNRENILIVHLKHIMILPTICINRSNSISNECICDGRAVVNISQE